MKEQKGFTLIELIVLIAIIGVLAAVAVPLLRNWSVGQNLAGDSGRAKSALQFAQMQAIKDDLDVSVYFDAADNSWTIFVDSDGNGVDNGSETVYQSGMFSSEVSIKKTEFTGTHATTAVLNSRGLSANGGTGTLTLEGEDGKIKKIDLKPSGVAEVE